MTTNIDVWKGRIELYLARMDNLKHETAFAIQKGASYLEYQIKAKTDFNASREKNEAFALEFIEYLRHAIPLGLETIKPTIKQLVFLDNLIDYANDEKLIHKESKRIIWCDKPVLASVYEAGVPYKDQRRKTSSDDISSKMSAYIYNAFLPFIAEEHILYNSFRDAITDSPLSIRVRSLKFPESTAFEFIFTEKKPENSKELSDMLPTYNHKNNTLRVYGNGDRFIIHFNAENNGRRYESTNQFFHVGTLKSEVEQKEFQVYGSNEDKHYTSGVESWL